MRLHLSAMTVSITLLVAACGSPSVDESLKRDLEAASAGSIELAPSGGQKVVSAIELAPQSKPVVTSTRRVPAPAPTRRPQIPQDSAVTNSEPAAVRPSTTPQVSPPPPGGYKTVGEVIRNAPFPIKP